MINIIFASLKKEFILVTRDLHALLVLFVMPTAFILIMSLATQSSFEDHANVALKGKFNIATTTDATSYFMKAINEQSFLSVASSPEDKVWFTVELTSAFEDTVLDAPQPEPAVKLTFAPELGQREQALVTASIKEAFALTNVYFLAEDLGYDEEYGRRTFLKEGAIYTPSNESNPTSTPMPNATQQNVPAWLVFAMFFVSIPISTTMILERNQKTLVRLQTMALSPTVLYATKLMPYLLINGLQLGAMLLVGRFLLPLFGGAPLSLDVPVLHLSLVGFSVSCAALGYAALIATLCRTVEQATLVSGVGSILFGALGGIMVPKFIMPPAMQTLTKVSPMNWGLEAFQDIFVRHESLSNIMAQCLTSLCFGVVLFTLSILLYRFNFRP